MREYGAAAGCPRCLMHRKARMLTSYLIISLKNNNKQKYEIRVHCTLRLSVHTTGLVWFGLERDRSPPP